MYVIKNSRENKFVKMNDTLDDLYPTEQIKLIHNINDAEHYYSKSEANDVIYWDLDLNEKWTVVNTDNGNEYKAFTGKYLTV